MDCSMESIYKKLVASSDANPKPDDLHLAILQHYLTFLRMMSEAELPDTCTSDYVFRVPTLKRQLDDDDGISKTYRPVKEFISFLVRFLYHKPRSIADSCGEQIKILEKELRFLLTVVGDASLIEELLAEFEAVANEAGCFVHSLFFGSSGGEMDVVNRINLLKANIIKLSHAVITSTTYVPPKTSVVDSLLVLDLVIRHLEDIMNHDDNPSADVKDQIQALHQGLISLQSFIKDTGSQQDQLKEYCMRIGDLAYEAQHLIVSFLAGDAPSWYLVNRLSDVNHKIELCRVELPEIKMKCKFGGLEVSKYFNKKMSPSRPKRNTAADDDIVGFEDNMTYILDQLVGGGAERRVISIFGMPGLGKTTLAKKLYNHPLVSERFDRLSWCVVSQSYLRRSVWANILIHIASGQLSKDVILEMEEQSLVENIHKTLKGRRYLIVMDDIWDSNVCDELLTCFPDDGNESRVLFTTRNKDVAPPNCLIYALQSLSDHQCWELIQKKVFNHQPCPPQLVEIGRELAASCGGMPLAAVVIAGILLNRDKEERAWEEVRRNMSWYILDGEDNFVMRILKLSYDHLPQHLKLCFLYLGVFLEDQEIPARHMMNMWIAEGFIDKENEKDAAEGYLNELIDKSLVMVAERRSDGGPKTVLVHDLLRELCFKACEEEKLTRFVNNKHFGNKEDGLKVDRNSTTWMCCHYMRNRFGQSSTTSSYQIEVPDMRLLRVLYFDCSFIYLTGIEYLVCLKYLVVPDLPPSISNLVNLEYIRVESNKMVYLSSAIMNMKNLKCVAAATGAIYACKTSQTNKLEILSKVFIRKAKDKKMLKCSPHLRKLKCVCYWWSKDKDLSFLTRLESLTLILKRGIIGWSKLSLPPSIKKLTLTYYGIKLPRKTMSIIGRLENLEVLKLITMRFEGDRWDTRDGEFQKLRYLRLHYVSLTRWNVGSSQHFPKLQRLELSLCYKLEGIPAEIGQIPTMRIIEVDEWQKESAKRIEEEQREMENEELRVVIRKSCCTKIWSWNCMCCHYSLIFYKRYPLKNGKYHSPFNRYCSLHSMTLLENLPLHASFTLE